jgi:Fe-S-cluster-containing hydrogenase component 2
MAMIMGIKPQDILTTREAALRGLGTAEINSLDILGEKLEAVRGKPFLLPTSTPITQKIPLPILKLAKKMIRYYPCVEKDNCVQCAACIQACPQKAIRMEKRCPVFEYSKCIACFCCQEACPQSAIKVKKSLLAKIIGL